ncbi:MAG: IPT/TIG domain-containing protein, partial [Chryseolinea sp.]
YLYRTTTIAQGLASDNRFAQPVNVYNNIHNGFGIFAGAASSVYEDTKPTPYITSVSPDHGKTGDVILISGGNFIYGEQSGVSVLFHSDSDPYGIYSPRLRPTADAIEAVVPEGVSTGKIRVDVIGGIVFSPDEFFIDE